MADPLPHARIDPPSADERGTLWLLGIFYSIIGGLEFLGFAMLLLINWSNPPIPRLPMFCFCGAAAIFTLSGIAMLTRKFRPLSFAVAICIIPFLPLGTILGVWTLVVLNKPGVKQIYGVTNMGRINRENPN
jgi:hypothetical protein